MKFFSYIKRVATHIRPRYEKILVFEKKTSDFEDKNLEIKAKLIIAKNIDSIKSLIDQREGWYHKWAQERFKGGNYCFALEFKGVIVSCVWTCFNQVYLPNVDYNLSVQKDVAPLLDGWTSPNYRKKGLYSFVMNACLKYLYNNTKYKKVYFFIRPENYNSIMIHKILPVVFYIRLINFFPFQRHIIQTENLVLERLIT